MANILPVRPKAGLDFVGDKEDAVLVEDLLDFTEIVERRNDDSAFAHDGLGDESGDIASGGEADDVFDASRTLPPAFLGIVGPGERYA
jgi:hypothetical protein